MCYPSDLTDDQFNLLYPFFKKTRRGPKVSNEDLRNKINAILYFIREGCQWRAIPKDFGHWKKFRSQYERWRDNGTLEHINTILVFLSREKSEREHEPTAGVIDAQTVKSGQKGGLQFQNPSDLTEAKISGAANG